MASRRNSDGFLSNRNPLSLGVIAVGALLLLVVPLMLLFFALTGAQNVHIPGTVIILSVVGGMALVIAGSALHD